MVALPRTFWAMPYKRISWFIAVLMLRLGRLWGGAWVGAWVGARAAMRANGRGLASAVRTGSSRDRTAHGQKRWRQRARGWGGVGVRGARFALGAGLTEKS